MSRILAPIDIIIGNTFVVVSARALFQDENYSLFNCRIPWQFHTILPVMVEDIISSSPIITIIPVPFGGGWMAVVGT